MAVNRSLRIASLLPSATEIVHGLGLGSTLVGVSHACDFPPSVRSLPVLTAPTTEIGAASGEIDSQVRGLVSSGLSVFRVDEGRLREQAPHVVLTQDTCGVCAVPAAEVREVAKRAVGSDVVVVSLAPTRVVDVWSDLLRVAEAVRTHDDDAPARATAWRLELEARLNELRAVTATLPRRRVLALEWIDPPMVAGHWIPELLELAGGDPVLGHPGRPTRPADLDRLREADWEVLIVAPCGFRLSQTLPELPALLDHLRVDGRPTYAVDGSSFFNRPGPRLVDSAYIAAAAMHGDRLGSRFRFGEDVIQRFPVGG